MKKIVAILLAAIMMMAVVAGCGGSSASGGANAAGLPADMKPVELKFAMSYATDHPAAVIYQQYCDKIAEETNGIIKIDFYPANTIGSEQEITDMVRSGDIFGGLIGMQMFENYVPEMAAWRLPFLFEKPEDFTRFFMEYAKDTHFNTTVLSATGVRCLGGVNGGARMLTTKGIEVHNPDDLKGQKIRSMEQPVSIALVEALGGNPIPVAWSELYMALQTNVAAGQENPIGNILSSKFYEVQDYLMLTAHCNGLTLCCVNDAQWQALPEAARTYLEAQFTKCDEEITKAVADQEADAIKQLQEYGMTVITQEDLDMEAFKANANAVVQKNFGEDAAMMEWYQDAQNWRDTNIK